MKKSFLLLLIVCLLIAGNQSLTAQAEKPVANRLIYTEFGGPSVTQSINYDARFNSGNKFGLGYRLGIGFGIEPFEKTLLNILENVGNIGSFFHIYSDKGSFATLPAGLNYIIGNPNKADALEIGAGVTLLSKKISLYN